MVLRKTAADQRNRVMEEPEDADEWKEGSVTKRPVKKWNQRPVRPAASVFDSVRKKYQRLQECLDDDGFTAEQFVEPEARIPYRAIALAAFLLVAGSTALIVSLLSMTGHITFTPIDGPYVLLGLGLVMLIPGLYHIRIAVYAFRQYPGYSFDDIPDFE